MTTAMAEGPAMHGTASGTMSGSSSGVARNIVSGWPNIIWMAMRKRTMPPAIWREC